MRFVPLTVFKDHVVSEVQLTGTETVYFVDYTGPKGFVQSVAAESKRVVVLDHHKTAAENLQGAQELPPNVELDIDMNRSGAMIALDYFKPAVSEQQLLMFRQGGGAGRNGCRSSSLWAPAQCPGGSDLKQV